MHVVEGLNIEAFLWTCIVATAAIVALVLGAVIAKMGDVQSAFAIVGLPVTVAIALLGAWLQYEKGRYA